ncbi:flagellar biosynthetic protein FliO [Anaerocolumna sp. AGMB13025]|uniref:flagellar biosynthetic protein FliO n=1 Tax=Anaerocolumna sp. AGMB13025 TaxID=3039116 RepID=UPI00241D88AC|nr:flagellar biosynthetic protein FliO [Anaerocolumna sp. AGMB13025]WFR54966.1 flagellar biosynthetic protein FliO [Anaerocolumna sp. AGMB13025]
MIILTAGMSSGDSLLQLIGVSILFIIILVVTYYTTRFVGGVKMGITKNSNFKVLETFKVTQNKYLQLIQIGTRYFVISVSKDDIRFLTELNETDIIRQADSQLPKNNFTELFHSVLKKQKDKNKTDQEDDQ